MPEIVAGVVGIVVLFVWVYCLYDVLTTEDSLIRNLPKVGWFVIVLVLFDLGAILWLCFGRPRMSSTRVAPFDRHQPRGPRSPVSALDDGPLDGLHPVVREREEQARLRMLEAQFQRREKELRGREFGEGANS